MIGNKGNFSPRYRLKINNYLFIFYFIYNVQVSKQMFCMLSEREREKEMRER